MQIESTRYVTKIKYVSIPKYIVNIVSVLIFSLLLHVNSQFYTFR